jgi:ABC-2 type transport system permease protein
VIDIRLLKDAIASEWTKLRSVRSTYWTIFAALIVGIGLGCAISAGNAHAYHSFDAHDRLLFDPTADSLSGLFFAQLAFAVFGVLIMSAEYTTGLIRTTIAAVPQRGYVLAAKAIMAAITATVISLVIAFSAFSLGQLIFSGYSARSIFTGAVIPGQHLNSSLSDRTCCARCSVAASTSAAWC